MSNQLITTPTEIIINSPVRPVRFHYESDGRGWLIDLRVVASTAEALSRLATGERRQGIIDLAIALGIEVREL